MGSPLQLLGEPLRFLASTSFHRLHQLVDKEICNLSQTPPLNPSPLIGKPHLPWPFLPNPLIPLYPIKFGKNSTI